jgi:hypothetical protein
MPEVPISHGIRKFRNIDQWRFTRSDSLLLSYTAGQSGEFSEKLLDSGEQLVDRSLTQNNDNWIIRKVSVEIAFFSNPLIWSNDSTWAWGQDWKGWILNEWTSHEYKKKKTTYNGIGYPSPPLRNKTTEYSNTKCWVVETQAPARRS